MRILIVSQYFWPESFIVNGLAQELSELGHNVEVLTGLPNYPGGDFSFPYGLLKGPWSELYGRAVVVHRTPILPRKAGFVRLAFNYLSFVVSATIRSFFLKKSYDVIFCYAPSPVLSCLPAIFMRWRIKKALVFWVQDLWPESVNAVGAIKPGLLMRALGKLVGFIYRRSDIILAPSRSFQKSILRWGGADRKIMYIPNWAEDFIDPQERPRWITDLPRAFRIGFAGNIGKAQDMKTLVSAALLLKDHSDIQWTVVGDGSELEWLRAEVEKNGLGDAVRLIGTKPYSEMLPFFRSCDLMYVSLCRSPIFSFTIPSKVQAYMSAGRPILASLDGEGAKIIEEAQCGLSVATESPEALVHAILKLKGFSALERAAMGARSAEYFKMHFEKKLVIKQIEQILKEAVFLG